MNSFSPLEKASKALILIHGRGGSSNDILQIASLIADKSFYVIAPDAPNRSWYPLRFMQDDKVNKKAIDASIAMFLKIMEDIQKHIPLEKIYLAGFSQGACLSLETTARHANLYGGVIAFSGGLMGEKILLDKYKNNFKGTPIFIGNSDIDPFIPLDRTIESKNVLASLGADVTLKIYPNMSHTINQDEIKTAKEILSR